MPIGENTTVEQLQSEVSELQDLVTELKSKRLPEKERRQKENEVKNKAQELQGQVDILSKQQGIDEKLREVRDTAKIVLASCNDTLNLQLNIGEQAGDKAKAGTTDNPGTSVDSTITTGTTEGSEKGFWGKTGDWVGEQWNKTKNWAGEQWGKVKENPRIVGAGVAVGVGMIMTIKKIGNRFSGNKDKEGISTDDESEKNTSEKKETQEEKKSFWKSTWGKVLKWFGVITVAGGSGFALIKAKSGNKENTDSSQKADQVQATTGKIDTSKVDTTGFTPGLYPFKHIKTPYKGISAYRVDNIKLDPSIGFSQLSLKGTEGELITLKVKDYKKHFSNPKAIGYKKNNPCNVSPFKGDIGRISSSKVADGQDHGGYKTMEDGLASFMRLMRQDRYRNKSIQGINCSGMQGVYSQNEPDSLKALRITRITHACENLNINPFVRLNTDDKETMMAFTQQTAINETGSYFDRATLERAYNKAFG